MSAAILNFDPLIAGLPKRFLEARRRMGTGPRFVRTSQTCVRYRPSDLTKWIEERLSTSTSEVA